MPHETHPIPSHPVFLFSVIWNSLCRLRPTKISIECPMHSASPIPSPELSTASHPLQEPSLNLKTLARTSANHEPDQTKRQPLPSSPRPAVLDITEKANSFHGPSVTPRPDPTVTPKKAKGRKHRDRTRSPVPTSLCFFANNQ
ncbi:hypothetical protein N431DRAFT_428096 [Stipitochalara longipes BDJ]|nr:hypothetical protein N431DRAFT_428096 [Stipitochalara longipes BDJ]